MRPGSEDRRLILGRHENQTIHDENGMRHYYDEWAKWMNREPSNPSRPSERAAAVAAE
jgi:methanesulfonate monooxygenase large subunit